MTDQTKSYWVDITAASTKLSLGSVFDALCHAGYTPMLRFEASHERWEFRIPTATDSEYWKIANIIQQNIKLQIRQPISASG